MALTILVGLVCLVLGAAVALAGYRQRLVRELAEVMGRRGEGRDGRAIPVRLREQLAMVGRVAAEADERSAAARSTEERLRGVIEGFPAAVVLFDAREQMREANQAGQRLLSGRHGDALVLEAVRELLHEVPRPGGDAAASRLVDLAGPPRRNYAVEVRLLPDGDRLAIVEDVSHRRRLEEVRRDFVANISHELKTPIGALALLAETMSEEDEPELLARLSQRMHREALRVGNTIDDLLMLSRIEAAEDPAHDPVELCSVVQESIERMASAAEAREIALVAELAEPVVISGDRRQLVSAVFNLLENAVKYSDERSTVTARVRTLGEEVLVEVTDAGMGIPTKDLERVFERFYRVDRARSRLTGGTGLGLAIVRHVAQNHGGSVQVVSREGEGSTFTLSLPLPPAPTGGPQW